jgi:hypothetical protein
MASASRTAATVPQSTSKSYHGSYDNLTK